MFLIYPQLENNGFENTRVDGTISSFEMDEETIGMTSKATTLAIGSITSFTANSTNLFATSSGTGLK